MTNQLTKEVRWLLEEKYQGVMTNQARQDITRLQKGEHIDYIIGFVNFLGCRIDLSSRPLIPRPETEYWTQRVIKEMVKQSTKRLRCLDIFAGSGCSGITVLAHIAQARMDFADIHEHYLKQIQINATVNGITASRYRLIHSDIFSHILGNYDYILANPPYIAKLKAHHVQKSVLDWEPHDALFGGEDGLAIIRTFLAEARDHLLPGGRIYMECDSWQKAAIKKILRTYGYQKYEFHKDQFGLLRFLVIHC